MVSASADCGDDSGDGGTGAGVVGVVGAVVLARAFVLVGVVCGAGAFGVIVSTAPHDAFGHRTLTGAPPANADRGTTIAAVHFVHLRRT